MIINLVIIGLLIIFVIVGFIKGFIKQLLGIAGTILALVLAALFCRPLVDIVRYNTPVFSGLQDWISGILPSIDKSVIESYPAFLQNIFAPILEDSATAIETVSESLTVIILSAAAFVLISVVVRIVVFVLGKLLSAIINKTPLSAINRLLGAAVGFAKGVLFISALLFIAEVTIVPLVPSVAEAVDKSVIAKMLMDFNVYGLIFKLVGLA